MKESIKSFLGKSRLIRGTYNTCLKKYTQSYRKVYRVDRSAEYRTLLTPSEETYEFSDGTLFEDGVSLSPHPKADNPVLTKADIEDAKATFVADPFLVFADGVYNMFFEIKDVAGEVYIGHAFSDDGVNYIYNQTVIGPEVAEHTYPYVFKLDDQWLMVPSPGFNINGQFRVYKATEFPTEWERIATPIPERVRQDPTPIKKDETWYLIYQDVESLDIILKYSDSLYDGNWIEHPASPIFQNDKEELNQCPIGAAEMVPSGRPIYHKNSIDLFYRSHLNKEVYQYRITELSEEAFEQHRVSELPVFANYMNQPWNERFMHTINPVYPWKRTENIVAVDGLKKDVCVYPEDSTDGTA
jgi:hypothetical protein